MKALRTETREDEIYQQMIVAIQKAESDGQPVQEIYTAIQSGKEIQIDWETSANGKVNMIISV